MDEEHYNTLSLQQLSFLKKTHSQETCMLFVVVGAHLFQVHLLVN